MDIKGNYGRLFAIYTWKDYKGGIMREIKFRAWHEKSKNMLQWELVNALCKGALVRLTDNVKGINYNYKGEPLGWYYETFYYGEEHKNSIFEDKDMLLEQFTGLHDKNGKEIYEGDIVTYVFCDDPFEENSSNITINVKIVFVEGSFVGSDGANTISLTDRPSDIEVIGNIHQDSHLLDKPK